MASQSLKAHSIAEAHFYLLATPCPRCGAGPLESKGADCDKPDSDEAQSASNDDTLPQHLCHVRCRSCDEKTDFLFTIPRDAPRNDPNDLYPIVNPSDKPSQILDVGQWLTLFRVVLESAGKEEDKIEARRLGYEAAQCLEEAIKFYDEGNELPPAEAVFCEATRAHLRDNPQQFAKRRLIELRGKLPKNVTMQQNISRDARGHAQTRRRWWKFWS